MEKIETNKSVKTVQSFKPAFNSQPQWMQNYLRRMIMYRCGWESRTTFYNKMNNETPTKPPEVAVITMVFAKHNIDAWSGEELEIIGTA